MYLKNFYYIFIIANLILLSGCTVVEWGKKTFNQGCKSEIHLSVPRGHMRNVRVYDEFVTLGIFNAMLISNDVIESYVNLHAEKNEMCEEERQILLNSEIEKTEKVISFYLLAYTPRSRSPIYVPNKYETAPWKVYLNVGCEVYEPYKIKIVELKPEYKLFFGKYLTKFKVVYLLEFLDKDKNGDCLIKEDTKAIKLGFTSFNNKVCLTWKLDKCGKVIYDPNNHYCEYEDPIDL